MLPVTPRTEPDAGAPYRTVPVSARRRDVEVEREGWPPYLRGMMWLLLALLAWTALLAWREHRVKADILGLPAPARHAVYTHAVDELRSICTAEPGLHDHCAAQAAFVLNFPDCDADCRTLAGRVLDHARR